MLLWLCRSVHTRDAVVGTSRKFSSSLSSSSNWVALIIGTISSACDKKHRMKLRYKYSLVLNTSHGVFPENCGQANFCMDITLLIPSRSWWDYKGHFQLALTGYTLNIRMIDKEMTELWHLKVCRVSYSSVSCIRDQRVYCRAQNS